MAKCKTCTGHCTVCTGCTGSCSGGCKGGCSGTCKGGCGGSCLGCTGNCAASCSGSCGGCGACDGTCDGKCTGCTQACSDSCGSTCSVGCGYCSGCSGCGGCSSSCSGSCNDACNDGCTGQNLTLVYNRVVTGTIIRASEISDLGNLIRNELTRRSKTPLTQENVATEGESILAKTINDFYTDIKSVDSSADITDQTSEDFIEKQIIDKYIENVKKLYSTKVDK